MIELMIELNVPINAVKIVIEGLFPKIRPVYKVC